jgi:hypothetical protein
MPLHRQGAPGFDMLIALETLERMEKLIADKYLMPYLNIINGFGARLR